MRKMDYLLVIFLTSVICTGAASAQDIAELTDSIGKSVASRNWDKADDGYEALYSAYQAEYGSGSRQALSMAKVLGEWKIQAYRNKLLSELPAQIMEEASAFYSSLIEEIIQLYGDNAEGLIDPLYGQAMVEYHLYQITSRKPISDYRGVGPEVIEEEQCVDSEDRGGVAICSYVEAPNRDYIESQAQAKADEIAIHSDAIVAALLKVAAICNQNQYLLDEAEALVHLGDYHLYGGEQATALDFYSRAYQQLESNAEGAEWIHRLFGQPTVVPSLTTSMPGADPVSIVTHGARFRFSISSVGKAEDIEVLSSGNSDREARQNTLRIISGATFRPYFDGAGVTESSLVEI